MAEQLRWRSMFVRRRYTDGSFAPQRFFRYKLVKLALKAQFSIEGVGRNRKTVIIRKDLAKRCAANFAETPAVLVRGFGLEEGNMFFPLDPLQVFSFDKHNGACTNFPTPGAMAGAHHRRLGQKFKLDRPTATASFNHLSISPRLPPFTTRTLSEQMWEDNGEVGLNAAVRR